MSFGVKFYQIDKKANSTKLPDTQTPAAEYDCVLKGACSVLAPVIQLTGGTAVYGNPTTYNYCYIANFGRYYVIDNWTWSGPAVIASLTVDVLATYRTQIGAQSLYVTRSASNYDPEVLDSTYPTKAEVTFIKNQIANPFSGAEGVYIVGIIGQDFNGSGSVTYYAFNRVGFRAFCNAMYSSISWLNISIDEISEDLQKALVNPFQYVVSCMYMPINVADCTGIPGVITGTSVKFGFWDFTVAQGYSIMQPTYFKTYTGMIAIPKHPQATTRGNYLNTSPYSSYTLAIYPFGFISLDSTDIMDATAISYIIYLDMCTGRAICNLDCGQGKLRVIETQVGVTIPTTSIEIDWSNWSSGLIAGGSQLVADTAQYLSGSSTRQSYMYNSGNARRADAPALDEAISSGAVDMGEAPSMSNIMSSALAAMSKPEISGSLGMQTGYINQTWSISGKFLTLVDEDRAHRGRPLCQITRIDTLSGYILVADGDFSIPGATASEQRAIASYLTGGFFWE